MVLQAPTSGENRSANQGSRKGVVGMGEKSLLFALHLSHFASVAAAFSKAGHGSCELFVTEEPKVEVSHKTVFQAAFFSLRFLLWKAPRKLQEKLPPKDAEAHVEHLIRY
jgi:hypothetical protein